MTATAGRHRAPRGARSSLLNGTDPLVAEAPKVPIKTIFARFWPLTKPVPPPARGRACCSSRSARPWTRAGIWIFKILIDDVLTPRDFALFPMVAAAYVGIARGWGTPVLRRRLPVHLGRRTVRAQPAHQPVRPPAPDVARVLRAPPARRPDVAARPATSTRSSSWCSPASCRSIAHSVQDPDIRRAAVLPELEARAGLADRRAAVRCSRPATSPRRIKAASREKRRRTGTISAVAEESLSNAALVQAYDRQDVGDRALPHREPRRVRRADGGHAAAGDVRPVHRPARDGAVLLVIGIGIWQLAVGRDDARRPAGVHGLPRPALRPDPGVRRPGQHRVRRQRRRRADHRDPRREAVGDRPRRPRARSGAPAGRCISTNVTFTYPGVDAPSLADLRFTIAPGQKLAVVGASGAGKTTLTKLLLRFYDPDRGPDHPRRGRPARARARRPAPQPRRRAAGDAGLRRHHPREHPLGSARGPRARVVAAAVAADAHEFISALPDGYDTRIGQRGRMLSGGQRQRLAIARAMIRNAPVLLLDEPTTGLDAASTERVLTPLRRLMAGPHVADHQPQPADGDRRRPDPVPGEGPDHRRRHPPRAALDAARATRSCTGCTTGRTTARPAPDEPPRPPHLRPVERTHA